jgi:hypothetical protein
LVDRPQAHQQHRPADALSVHSTSLVSQVPRHLMYAVKS